MNIFLDMFPTFRLHCAKFIAIVGPILQTFQEKNYPMSEFFAIILKNKCFFGKQLWRQFKVTPKRRSIRVPIRENSGQANRFLTCQNILRNSWTKKGSVISTVNHISLPSVTKSVGAPRFLPEHTARIRVFLWNY